MNIFGGGANSQKEESQIPLNGLTGELITLYGKSSTLALLEQIKLDKKQPGCSQGGINDGYPGEVFQESNILIPPSLDDTQIEYKEVGDYKCGILKGMIFVKKGDKIHSFKDAYIDNGSRIDAYTIKGQNVLIVRGEKKAVIILNDTPRILEVDGTDIGVGDRLRILPKERSRMSIKAQIASLISKDSEEEGWIPII